MRIAAVDWWKEAFQDQRLRRFWGLGLFATFLHGIIDPLVTVISIQFLGIGIESNVWLGRTLREGVGEFTIIHIPLYLVSLSVLTAFTWLFAASSEYEKSQLWKISLIFWALIILWGLLIIGNNIIVMVAGIT